MKKWKQSITLPFTKSLNRLEHYTWHHFPKINSSRWCWHTQFSSTAEFGNEMKLKLRLLPFSLICIQCQCVFCFQFHILLYLSKFWYTLAVRLGILGSFQIPVTSKKMVRNSWDILKAILGPGYHQNHSNMVVSSKWSQYLQQKCLRLVQSVHGWVLSTQLFCQHQPARRVHSYLETRPRSNVWKEHTHTEGYK